jgi:dTDP-4-dehydrorhamnose reductase
MNGPVTVLLLGKSGQIGHALQDALGARYQLVACGRSDVDLTQPQTIRQAVRNASPDVIVNAAAYTAVDQAEEEPRRARLVNAEAPGVLAEEVRSAGALLVHYSTDYVFDGKADQPYRETDPPNPLSVYGQTKWEGEEAIRAAGCAHLILRTSGVYSGRRSNFLKTMLRLASERDAVDVVDDQCLSPTWAGWVATATTELLEGVVRPDAQGRPVSLQQDEPFGDNRPQETFHLASRGEVSWHGFSEAIFQAFGQDGMTVRPISSAAYGAPAPRPAYSVLSTRRIEAEAGLAVPTWREQLRACRAAEFD